MKSSRTLTSLTLLALGGYCLAQGDPAVNARIVDIGKNRNQVWKTLNDLTSIGPRLTTSHTLDEASQWCMEKFKSYGLTNVHLEKWGEWPWGFQRGDVQWAKMTSPWKLEFEFTSPSWTPGTEGPLKAKCVLAPGSPEEFENVKNDLVGKWVVFTEPSRRGRENPVQTLVEGLDIAGIVTASSSNLVITSGRYNVEEPSKVRHIIVRERDMVDLKLALTLNRDTEIEVNMEQEIYKGPIANSNVIADIKGTEFPDEYVIVSGHLDSWDGPGSVGASDNGTGSSVTLETARILMAAGAKPKRTIRFILWTGEEQGLHGSRQYVEMHKDELDKISAVFVDDGGSNYQGGMTCTKEMEAMLKEAQAPMTGVFPDMPFEFRIVEKLPRGGGSDHASFNAVGVPGFFWFETGRQNYRFIHHTQHDTVKYAIPEYLVQSATNSAVMSYNLACASTLLPRPSK